MCGISGIMYRNGEYVSSLLMEKINDTLVHRGPDFGSVKLFGNVALAHRRLSIIDLSSKANQPMQDAKERYTVVFNGEIYNFKEIKEVLKDKGVEFFTTSDTEVVLNAFITFGFNAFRLFNGMFALGIYDKETKQLILARDQFGIKPLYYLNDQKMFIFASEKKAILQHPDLHFSINNQALTEYIWFGNPLGENTIYKEIQEVKPGSYLIITEKGIKEYTYFDINDIIEKKISEAEAIEKIKGLFEDSVKRHLISDVPVGVFLSGGIDSSAITAYASKHYNGRLKTFSVQFDYDKGINELSLAREVAKKFNTDHQEVTISGKNIIHVIEELVKAHDEPFGDAADIPLYLLTKQLEGTIKVVLQGDGGDEFFGGYRRYNTLSKVNYWKAFSFLIQLILISETSNYNALRLQRFLNAITKKNPFLRNALLLTSESEYSNPLRVFNADYLKAVNIFDPFKKFEEIYNRYQIGIDPTQALFYTDTQTILKDTYFEKVDKSTMANSIEVRVPFLDKQLCEFMLSVPASLKIKNGKQKYLLKKSLSGIVPDNILYGKKKGFGVPYEYWLRTSLANYFIEQISTEKCAFYLNKKELLEMFNLHKSNKGNFGFLLWKTLILAVWVNNNNNNI